jgi:hypothetical protein
MKTTIEVNASPELKLAIRGESGGHLFSYDITQEQFLKLAAGAFLRESLDSKLENAKSGGVISGFLHAYGMTQTKAEKAGKTLTGWTFDETVWINTVFPPKVELTEEEKKAAADKRALTAKQAAWDKAAAPWIKKGMTVEELSHADLYGPRPA